MTSGLISTNFYDYEFRCRCGCGKLFVYLPLLSALEKLRHIAGDKPIHPLSGCRCWKHNLACGGATDSQHLCENNDLIERPTKACDIYIAGVRPRQMFQMALKVPEFRDGGIGVYEGQGFIHADVRGYKARWFVANKGAGYEQIPKNYW